MGEEQLLPLSTCGDVCQGCDDDGKCSAQSDCIRTPALPRADAVAWANNLTSVSHFLLSKVGEESYLNDCEN